LTGITRAATILKARILPIVAHKLKPPFFSLTSSYSTVTFNGTYNGPAYQARTRVYSFVFTLKGVFACQAGSALREQPTLPGAKKSLLTH
jgi:hypothetical protein